MVDRMLFEQRLWAGLADGTVTVTFRRWRRPRARAGGRHRTPAGVLAIDAVAEVDPADLTEGDARAAGFGSLAELLRQLDGMATAWCTGSTSTTPGPIPGRRCARPTTCPTRRWPGCAGRLDRLDRAGPDGAWTIATLRLIGDRPGCGRPTWPPPSAGSGTRSRPTCASSRSWG